MSSTQINVSRIDRSNQCEWCALICLPVKTQLELKRRAPIKNKAPNSSMRLVCPDAEAAVGDAGLKLGSPVLSRNRLQLHSFCNLIKFN